MFFENENSEDLYTIPINAPRLVRQKGYSDLLALLSLNDTETNYTEINLNDQKRRIDTVLSINSTLSIDSELTFDKIIFRSNTNFNYAPKIKRHKSESDKYTYFNTTTKSKRYINSELSIDPKINFHNEPRIKKYKSESDKDIYFNI